MSLIRFGGLIGLACLLLVPAGRAQISTSSSYQLVDFVLDDGGGGTASVNYAAAVSLGGRTGGQFTSANFKAGLGILETSDPQPSNLPVVFGITPDFGPKAGGTAVTITGLNFDKFGAGPSVTVDVGGSSATGVNVASNTLITATVPAGAKGPQDLTVSSSFGSSFSPGAFIYTPAITTTPNSVQGGTVTIRNYGEVGNVFNTYISNVTTSANTKFGTLLIGPFPIYLVLPVLSYTGPDGINEIVADVPVDPALDGLTVYFQSLDISGFGPVTGELTNRSSTTFP
jgi:hypothetical protein